MTTFGRYTLVRKVGTGGMAEIWKAKAKGPQGFEKILAIKKVLPHLVEDGEFIEMFVAEAKLVATLMHPNIVQVFDFGQIGKSDYFIAMEYVAGANLAQLIRRLAERRARMPLEVALYVTLEAVKGLGYAHAKSTATGEIQNIVHRDVSPQNILLSYGGEVKVTDFGIAKVASALTRTAEGHVRGKLAYMSPEQAATKPLDNRSDLFSLGLVLHELVTGRRVFAGSSSSEIYAKVTNFQQPSVESLAGLPEEIQTLIRTVLQPNPDLRYQDAMEMESALAESLGPNGIVQARHALASIVQRLFEEERKLESEVSFVGPVPEEPGGGAETVVQDHSASIGVGAVQEVVPGGPPAAPGTIPSDPRATPSVSGSSGLTLAKPNTGKQQVQILAGVPGAAAPPARSRLGIAAFAVGGVAIIALAYAGGRYFATASPMPTATATQIALATDTPPPGITPVLGTPEATATPDVSVTQIPLPTHTPHIAPTHSANPTPTARPPAQPAMLSVNANPWVQVFLDNKLIAPETPLRRFTVPAGYHLLRFVNPAAGFSKEQTIEFSGGAEKSYFVDVKKGTVRLETVQNR